MSAASVGRPIEILLVEDSPGDARLALEALKATGSASRMHVVEDGVQAMAFLQREGDYADAVRPDLILLDLNLPRKDGREVLAEIKDDRELSQIPVVVLTTSRDAQDVARAHDLHANCYVTKPVDLYEFMDVVKSIEQFWSTIAHLPGRVEA